MLTNLPADVHLARRIYLKLSDNVACDCSGKEQEWKH